MLGAALTGVLTSSPVYVSASVPKLRLQVPGEGVHLARDGEVARAPEGLLLEKVPEGLVVYRGA
jgi:undecaprenyl-diphosphatase